MTRRAIRLVLLACTALAGPYGALNAQDQPQASAAARARVQEAESRARKEYGARSPLYYRALIKELKAVAPPPSVLAPPSLAPEPQRLPRTRVLTPPEAAPPPVALPGAPVVAPASPVPPLVTEKLVTLVTKAAEADLVKHGMEDTPSLRLARSLPKSLIDEPPPLPVAPPTGALARALEKAKLITDAFSPSGARGVAGVASSLRGPVRPGLKDRVAGLGFVASAGEDAAVDRDPNDPYPDTVALGVVDPATGKPLPGSLCSGALIARTADMGAVLTAAHCVCSAKTHVFIGYNVVKTPSCTRDPDYDPGLEIIDSTPMRPDACVGEARRHGADVAVVFFKRAPPGRKSYFLDAVIQNRAAIIPEKGMMELLAGGLVELGALERTSIARAVLWAESLGLKYEDIWNDLKVNAEFMAMLQALTVTKPPVGLTAVGFGATARNAAMSTVGCKGWAHFTQKGFINCGKGADPDTGECVADKEFVLQESDDGGNDTCNGDSGGPVYAETLAGSQRYVRYLVGLTSRAAKKDPNARCGKGGIYSLVARDEVIAFIQQELKRYGMAPKVAPRPVLATAPAAN